MPKWEGGPKKPEDYAGNGCIIRPDFICTAPKCNGWITRNENLEGDCHWKTNVIISRKSLASLIQ
jgi:hypothetical protein